MLLKKTSSIENVPLMEIWLTENVCPSLGGSRLQSRLFDLKWCEGRFEEFQQAYDYQKVFPSNVGRFVC